jgi:uracil-DNA glycosylase family 4
MAIPEDLVNNLKQYFLQQTELYGDELAVSKDVLLQSIQQKKQERSDLMQMHEEIKNCQKCPLGRTRHHVVFGAGREDADIMLIGEAPGADEDRIGEPFVGRAGQLLTKILKAINLDRNDVFISNILKCRPPGNRDPLPYEIEQCEPYLIRQLELIQPKFILTLGRIAAQTLLKTTQSLGRLRGKVHEYHGVRLIATYHPAALLRYPHYKTDTWQDVQLLRSLYDEMREQNRLN